MAPGGDSRDGKGYKDVTDSNGPEVVAARKRFTEILADKPAPSPDKRLWLMDQQKGREKSRKKASKRE